MNDGGLYGHGQLATLLRAPLRQPRHPQHRQNRRAHFLKVREIVDWQSNASQTATGSNGKSHA